MVCKYFGWFVVLNICMPGVCFVMIFLVKNLFCNEIVFIIVVMKMNWKNCRKIHHNLLILLIQLNN